MSVGEVLPVSTNRHDLRSGPRIGGRGSAAVSLVVILVVMPFVVMAACGHETTYRVVSPNGAIQAVVRSGDGGSIRYTVVRDGDQVVLDSKLGITMEDTSFVDGLTLRSATEPSRISDHYSMMTGKRRDITYEANQRTLTFVNRDRRMMDIAVRASNDGVAFRYEFPGRSDDTKTITEELTTFRLKPESRAWLQPMQVAQTGWKRTNPAYEEHYRMGIPAGTPSPDEAGWVLPALFESDGTWILISEAGTDGRYCGSRLGQSSQDAEYQLGFPMAAEVFTGGALLPESTLPFHSPWRIIAVGSLATIVESTLGTDLADPAPRTDLSWVKPGQASWSWAILKDESIIYDVQKEFIDYAAAMGWEYTLIDVNWDTRIGYDGVRELAGYAARKNVGLLLWYNSSGDWNETDYHPKSMLLTHAGREEEFSRLQAMGIRGVKVDFFAGDGSSMIQYFRDILEDAADHRLLVNFHGATIPRGLQRSYPNLMTVEAVRGFEFITFFQEDADLEASHAAVLPFTRNVFDPMDFTPMVLDRIPDRVRTTTNGFQLALPVLFLSGIQHMAETPEGMRVAPDYVKAYLRGLPEQWDESRFVDGYPGKLAVIARRSGDRWFVAGVNGEPTAKQLVLDLSFIAARIGHLLTDGEEELSFRRREVAASESLQVELRPNGGFVAVFE
jgi:alpha-glucosidase